VDFKPGNEESRSAGKQLELKKDFKPGNEESRSAGKQLELKKQEKIKIEDFEMTFVGFDVSGMMGQKEGQDVSVGADLLVSYKSGNPVSVKPIITKGQEGW
jgi:hypothetical protein